LLLDITAQETFTDYFVFCNGTSDRQLEALRDGIRESVKETFHVTPWSREGNADEGWLLLDYSDVIVHLFSPEKRAYYDLEGLWSQGKVLLQIQ
jgi:ribosome-associated protein